MRRRITLIIVVLTSVAMLTAGIWWYVASRSGAKLLSSIDLAFQAGDVEKSLRLASSYVAGHPDDWRGYYEQGRSYSGLNRFDEARRSLQEAVKRNPADMSIATAMADTYSLPARQLAQASDGLPSLDNLKEGIRLFKLAEDYLAKLPASGGKPALDVRQYSGMNLIQLGRAELLLGERLEDQAKIKAGTVGSKDLAGSIRQESQESYAAADTAFVEATKALLDVVSKDPTRDGAARNVVKLCLERDDQAGLSAVKEAIKASADSCPIATAMLARHELLTSGEPVGSAAYRQRVEQFDNLLKHHPAEVEIRLARAEIALNLADRGQAATTQPITADEAAREQRLARDLCDDILKGEPLNYNAGRFRARVAILQGNLADAESRLVTIRNKYPWQPEVQFELAQVALKAGHKSVADEAMRAIVDHAAVQPRDFSGRRLGGDNGSASVVADARKYIIQLLRDQKYAAQAFVEAQAFFLAAPDNVDASGLFAELAIATKHEKSARDAFAETAQKYDGRAEMLLNVGLGYSLLGDGAAAARTFGAVAKLTPATVGGKLAVADAMTQIGQLPQAESLLEGVLAQMGQNRSPAWAQAQYALYVVCRKSGRTGQALDHIRAAVRASSGNVPYRLRLAHLEFETGRVDNCLEECQKVLRQDQSNLDAKVLIGQCKIVQDQPVDFEPTLAQGGPQAGLELAYGYLAHSQPDKCVALCLETLGKNPEEANARYLLARAYLAMGQYDNCVKQLAQLVASAGQPPAVYKQIALVLSQSRTADQVAEAMSALPGARRALVDLAVTEIRERRGESDAAAAGYKSVLEGRDLPDELRPMVVLRRARLLGRMGKLDPAIAELDAQAGQAANKSWAKDLLFLKAQLLLAGNKQDQAEPILADLVAKAAAEQDLTTLEDIVRVRVKMRQFGPAEALCDQMQQVAPGEAQGYSAKALVLSGTGRLHEAIDYFQKAVDRQPVNFRLRRALAAALTDDQEPLRALEVYKNLEGLGQLAQMEALAQEGTMFVQWGLLPQAIECIDKLASAGAENNPRLELALGLAFRQLGQKDKARAMLGRIPVYAEQYQAAQQALVALADKLDEKLAILDRLEATEPGQPGVAAQRIGVLTDGGQAGDAAKAFTAFADQYAQGRLMDRALYGPAFIALLAAGNRSAAADLAIRASKETASPQWRGLATLLAMDERPEAVADLLPDVSKAEFFDAVMGLIWARKTGEPIVKWADRLAETARLSGQRNPPVNMPATYQILADLAGGSPGPAKERLAKLDAGSVGLIGRKVIAEQIAAAEGNPAGKDEAAALMRALLAGYLGSPELSREWALAVLKARPGCQWAAAIILESKPEAALLGQVAKLLQPQDCTMVRAIRAKLLAADGKHAEAAELYGQLGQSEHNPLFLRNQAGELEAAGRFDQALATCREIWKATTQPAGAAARGQEWKAALHAEVANDCAALVAWLTPDQVKQSTEVGAWLDAAGGVANNDASFRDTRGWIRYLQGQTEAALKDLRFAANGRPDSCQIHYHLAVAEAASGHNEFARWHLAAAVDIGQRLKDAGKSLTPGDVKVVDEAKEMLAKMPATAP